MHPVPKFPFCCWAMCYTQLYLFSTLIPLLSCGYRSLLIAHLNVKEGWAITWPLLYDGHVFHHGLMLREPLQLGPFLCYACPSSWKLFFHPHLHHLLLFYLLLLYRPRLEATLQCPFKEAGPSPLQSVTGTAAALCWVQYFGFQSVNWVDSIEGPAYFGIISMKILQPQSCQTLQSVLWPRKMTIYKAFVSLQTKSPPNSLESKSTLHSHLGPRTHSCGICCSQKERHNSGGQSRYCNKYVEVFNWLIWREHPFVQAWTGQRSLRGSYPVQKSYNEDILGLEQMGQTRIEAIWFCAVPAPV